MVEILITEQRGIDDWDVNTIIGANHQGELVSVAE